MEYIAFIDRDAAKKAQIDLEVITGPHALWTSPLPHDSYEIFMMPIHESEKQRILDGPKFKRLEGDSRYKKNPLCWQLNF